MRNRYWVTLALPIFCLLATGTSKTLTVEEMTERRSTLNDEVMALTQPLTCKSNYNCATIEMGTKPCGGPWKHILYSKTNSKNSALKKKITEYNKLDQKINEATQVMSDCAMMLPPEPKCVNRLCVDTTARNAAHGSTHRSKKVPTAAESLAPATDH